MKSAKGILIIISYIIYFALIVVGLVDSEFYKKYKMYVLLLQVLFFCTGPLLVFIDWIKNRNKDKLEVNRKSE